MAWYDYMTLLALSNLLSGSAKMVAVSCFITFLLAISNQFGNAVRLSQWVFQGFCMRDTDNVMGGYIRVHS